VQNDVVFNQLIVACDTPEETKTTLREIQQGGVCWCGGAVWQNTPVIRVSVCSWRTTQADVEISAAEFARARQQAQLGQ
jgi:hypothetical protein